MRDDPSQLITTSPLPPQHTQDTTTIWSKKTSEDRALPCYDLKLLTALIDIILGLKLYKLGALNILLYHPRFVVPKMVLLLFSVFVLFCFVLLLLCGEMR
jgi:hypothetical protein